MYKKLINTYIPPTEYKESTKFYWNVLIVLCVQNSILYPILCALTTIFFHIPYFSPVSPFKIFPTLCSPQYCFSQFLLARMNFLSLFHSTVSFKSLNSSLSPFLCSLCSLSFSFHSWNGADSFFFVSIPSTPQQLFSLSLTSSFHLLCICLFLILYQPDMVGQAAPLDETQENLYSLAINAKYSNDRRLLVPVAQIRFSEKV